MSTPGKTSLQAYVQSIGLLGPGLSNWPAAAAVLRGTAVYEAVRTEVPMPAGLPAAERRRTNLVVKLALAAGFEAVAAAELDARGLATVFSSSGADGSNCHEICQTLATDHRELSPTRFHNSVHNAAAGYWGIATGATAPSNVLCAFDASFAAGLLEAMTQAVVEARPVLLIAYDTDYPPPLLEKRPIPDSFAVALLLSPLRTAGSLAALSLRLESSPAETMSDAGLEALRSSIPAARALPLLRLIARHEKGRAGLQYLPPLTLETDVTPCN